MRGVMSRFVVVFFTAGLCLSPAAFADDRVTERVSTGPLGGNAPVDTCDSATTARHTCRGVLLSADGTTAVFTTEEQLTADDGDTLPDIYERSGGVTRLV